MKPVSNGSISQKQFISKAKKQKIREDFETHYVSKIIAKLGEERNRAPQCSQNPSATVQGGNQEASQQSDLVKNILDIKHNDQTLRELLIEASLNRNRFAVREVTTTFGVIVATITNIVETFDVNNNINYVAAVQKGILEAVLDVDIVSRYTNTLNSWQKNKQADLKEKYTQLFNTIVSGTTASTPPQKTTSISPRKIHWKDNDSWFSSKHTISFIPPQQPTTSKTPTSPAVSKAGPSILAVDNQMQLFFTTPPSNVQTTINSLSEASKLMQHAPQHNNREDDKESLSKKAAGIKSDAKSLLPPEPTKHITSTLEQQKSLNQVIDGIDAPIDANNALLGTSNDTAQETVATACAPTQTPALPNPTTPSTSLEGQTIRVIRARVFTKNSDMGQYLKCTKPSLNRTIVVVHQFGLTRKS